MFSTNKVHIGIAILVILIIAVVLYFVMVRKSSVKENYIPVGLTAATETVSVAPNGQVTLLPQCSSGTTSSFVSVPNYQSMLAPRFNPGSYPANIQYKIPSYQNLAVPSFPLGDTIEPFTGSSSGCQQCDGNCGDMCKQTGMLSSQISTVGINNVSTTERAPTDIVNSVPVGTMTSTTLDGTSEQTNVIYNRLIYKTKKSNLASNNCPIRGSLAIAPRCSAPEDRWFQVSADPARDLLTGYANSIAGVNAGNTEALATIKSQYSGNDSLVGVAYNDINTSLGPNGDVNNELNVRVTAFP